SACTWADMGTATPCQKLASSNVAFLGTVLDGRPDPLLRRHTFGPAVFPVEQIFKRLPEGTRQVDIDSSGGSCAVQFRSGERAIVYAWRSDDGRFRTSYCMGSVTFP